MLGFLHVYRGALLLGSSGASSSALKRFRAVQRGRVHPSLVSLSRLEARGQSLEDMTLLQLEALWNDVGNLAKSSVQWDINALCNNAVWVKAFASFRSPDTKTLVRAKQVLQKWVMLCSNKASPEESRRAFKRGVEDILKSNGSAKTFGEFSRRCLVIKEDTSLPTAFERWSRVEGVLQDFCFLPEHSLALRLLLNDYIKCREVTEEESEDRKARAKGRVLNRCRHSKDSLAGGGGCSCSRYREKGRRGSSASSSSAVSHRSREGSLSSDAMPTLDGPGPMSRQGSSTGSMEGVVGGEGGGGPLGSSRRSRNKSQVDLWERDLQEELIITTAPLHQSIRLASADAEEEEEEEDGDGPWLDLDEPAPLTSPGGVGVVRRRLLHVGEAREGILVPVDKPEGGAVGRRGDGEEVEQDEDWDDGVDPFDGDWEMEAEIDELGPLASDEEYSDSDMRLVVDDAVTGSDLIMPAVGSCDVDPDAFSVPLDSEDPWTMPDPYIGGGGPSLDQGQGQGQEDDDLLPTLLVVRRGSSRSSVDGAVRAGRSWESPRLQPRPPPPPSLPTAHDHHDFPLGQQPLPVPLELHLELTLPASPPCLPHPPFIQQSSEVSGPLDSERSVSSYLARESSFVMIMDDSYLQEEEHMLKAMFDNLGSGSERQEE